MMDGIVEMAEQVLDLPARHGMPDFVGGLMGDIDSPIYATVVGTLLYGFHKQMNSRRIHSFKDSTPARGSLWERLFARR
jgi:cell division protein FtsA